MKALKILAIVFGILLLLTGGGTAGRLGSGRQGSDRDRQ